jgi:hypothetical protein
MESRAKALGLAKRLNPSTACGNFGVEGNRYK